MHCDQMTSRERWDALVRGEPLDRVPCLQFMLGHAAVVNGKPIAKVYDDAAMSLACQLNAKELYGHDGLILHGWANAGGAEFGGVVEYPYRKYTGAPMMKANPVQTEDDAWNLRVPDDITTVGTIPIALEFSRLEAEAGLPVTLQVGSSAHLGGVGLRRGAARGLDDQEARPGAQRAAGRHRLHPREGRLLGEGVRGRASLRVRPLHRDEQALLAQAVRHLRFPLSQTRCTIT